MNLDDLQLELDSSKLNINLSLYRIIKNLIQTKISPNQNIILIEYLILLENTQHSFIEKKECLFQQIEDSKERSTTIVKINNFLDSTILCENDFQLLKIALNLNRFKKLILEKSKLISENFRVDSDIHIMDFAYDYNMLVLPYTVRVAGALLFKLLFKKLKETKTLFYQNIQADLEKIEELDANTISQIIYAESASQSIRSSSGNNYEDRFKTILTTQQIIHEGQSHDSKIAAVEYDFTLSLNNKKIGVSAKRTLRERYKQNHEEVNSLDVDAMLLVTLGIDLNEAKINYITQKEKYYIFVASDIYDKENHLNSNDKVYPLTALNNNLLSTLL